MDLLGVVAEQLGRRQLLELGLGLLDILLGAAHNDDIRLGGLVSAVGEVDVHAATLVHDGSDNAALGADDGRVEARLDVQLLAHNAGQLVLQADKVIAGLLGVGLLAGDDNQVAVAVLVGEADAHAELLADLTDVRARAADDLAVEVLEDGDLQLEALLLEALDELADVLLGRLDVLLVAADDDNLGVALGHVDVDAGELLRDGLDRRAARADDRAVEALRDDDVDAAHVLLLRDDLINLGGRLLHGLLVADDADSRGLVLGDEGQLSARLLADLRDDGAVLADQVGVVLGIDLLVLVHEDLAQLAREGVEDGAQHADLVRRAIERDLVALLVEVDAHIGRVLLPGLHVGAAAADDVAVQPLGDRDDLVGVAVGLLLDESDGRGQIGVGAAQDDLVAGVVRGGHLDRDAGLLHDLGDVGTLGTDHIAVLGLLDRHGGLAASLAHLVVDGVDLLHGHGDTGLLARDDDVILVGVGRREVDAHASGLGDLVDVGVAEAGNEGVEVALDGQANRVELGLLVRNLLNLGGRLAGILHRADDRHGLLRVVARGHLDGRRGVGLDVLEDLALLADDEAVQLLRHGNLQRDLGLKAAEQHLPGLLDVLDLASDGDRLVLADTAGDGGVGVIGDGLEDRLLLAHRLRFLQLLVRDGEHLRGLRGADGRGGPGRLLCFGSNLAGFIQLGKRGEGLVVGGDDVRSRLLRVRVVRIHGQGEVRSVPLAECHVYSWNVPVKVSCAVH
eukprot:m.28405 g.28405  ORF g.28405 m.28405 type:complete len:735 (-) comp4552_c0_seq1:42-2246(-)